MWYVYISSSSSEVYRYTILSNFEELEILFCGRAATGKFAQSSAIAAAQYAIIASSSLAASVSSPSSDRKSYRFNSPQLSDDFCAYSDNNYDVALYHTSTYILTYG